MTVVLLALSVHGRVRDATTRAPLGGVAVRVVGSGRTAVSDTNGAFRLDAAPNSTLQLTRAGYVTREAVVADSVLELFMVPSTRTLEGVTVTAIRGERARGGGAPITQRVVSRDELKRGYSGQEMPLLLSATPSVTSYADGGAFSNYTYMRLRGIDQTRINITLDGVPLNDSEDQGVFFSNFPDFAASVQSVQIQRGVGTSSQGTASYAGSVNFESIALASGRRRGEVQFSRGAFNTSRASGEWQSGLMPNKFAFYGRLSALNTDGYRYHSGNRSEGGLLSAGYFGNRTSVKVTALTGVSRNHEAYLASSLEQIRKDARDNPLSDQERDRFTQSMVSASLTRLMGSAAIVSATAYTVSAGGEYDVRIDPTLWNFNLRSRVSGAFVTWSQQVGGLTLTVGAHGNRYSRTHFLFIHPDLSARIYDNTGDKDEASTFAKAAWEVGPVTFFGDAQIRHVWYRYDPDVNADIGGSRITWDFFNPKVGATWQPRPSLSFYASVGRNGREPARNDMFAGFDNVDTSNVAFVGPLSRVRPEHVRDIEAGVQYQTPMVEVQANLFDMAFHNEITPIGALSYIGLPLRKNVGSSVRRGLEVDARYRAIPRLVIGANAAWSYSRIADYTDDASQQRYRNVPPLLTPTFVGNQSADLHLTEQLSLAIDGRYVSRSFLANTGDARFVTPPFYLADGAVTCRVGLLTIVVQVRNIANREVFTGGYTDGVTSYYYLMARRNVIASFRLGF